jgi:type III restriction enzyme
MRQCVFKAPTGSGKTIMTAEWLRRLETEPWSDRLVFVWISLYDLHSQSHQKVKRYLGDSSYSLVALDEMGRDALPSRSVVFVNWHSLTTQKTNPETGEKEWANVFVKDGESGKSIKSVLEKTRNEGKELVLIVDEAHRNYLTENSQKFVREIFQPKLILEISATPIMKIEPEEIVNKTAGFVSVPFAETIASGLIKTETVINANIGDFVDIANSADQLVVSAAIAKRNELALAYKTAGINVNPLVLVQLPSETEATSVLDKSVRENVESQLAELGISYESEKLAVWLSGEKRRLDLIEKNDSEVEVLIFKEAVAVGWDCPRAQILVMLRAIRSIPFEIQTVGRILRTPEAKHYEKGDLDRAFVYTNLNSINISDKPDDLDFFKTKLSTLRSELSGVAIPSEYLHRQDYGDLTANFSSILFEKLNARFKITADDMAAEALMKADVLLELETDELKKPIISDLAVKNWDSVKKEIGDFDIEYVRANVSDANIQREFDFLLKAWSLPYAPVRSFTKIKTGLYRWFGSLGFESSSWDSVQRIVSCSVVNQQVIGEAIEESKKEFEKQKLTSVPARNEITQSIYSPPALILMGEKSEEVKLTKYGYEPALLSSERSAPERQLEAALEKSQKVEWWIKNGEGQKQFLSLVYGYVDAQSGLTKQANFYPDFVVKFKDGSIGIYETKSGMTLTDYLTAAKSDTLQKYIMNNSKLKLVGGVVNATSEGLRVFENESYTAEQSQWEPLKI